MSVSARRKKAYWICRGAFLVYVLILIYLLFFCERYGRTVRYEEMQYNLIPFEEINRYIQNWRSFTIEQFMANIAGNICLFIPFGALLFVWVGRPVSFIEATLSSMFLSIAIEIVQLFSRVGVCDVDDVIMNTVGGMIGFFVYLIVRTIYRRYVNAKQ